MPLVRETQPPAPESTILAAALAGARNPVSACVQQRLVRPILDHLRVGTSPRRLAWSVAIAAAVAINPVIGTTTLSCLGLALLFRLSAVLMQAVNYLLFPVQLALMLVFMRLGDRLFHTQHVPVTGDAFAQALRLHDWATLQILWTWEWHALLVWLPCALLMTPLLGLVLAELFARLAGTLRTQQATRR